MRAPTRADWPWVAAIGLVAVCLLPLLAWLDAPIHRPQDEGLLLVYPDLILRGALPHRDFLATYPPGNFFALAGVFALFEPSVGAERLVGLAYRYGLVFAVVGLAVSRGPVVAACCGVSAAFLLFPLRLEAFSWIGGLAALAWGVVALLHDRPRLAGLLVAIAVSFRLDLLLAAALVSVVALWLYQHNWRAAAQSYLQGLGCILLPLFAFFVWVSPQSVLQDLVLDPLFASGPARRLPLASLGTNSLRLFLLLVSSVGVTVLVAWRERELPPRQRGPGFATAALVLGLLPQAFQRLDADHLLYVLAVAGGLLPASLDRLLDGRLRRSTALALAGVVLTITAGTPISALFLSSFESRHPFEARGWLHRNDRGLPSRNRHELLAFSVLGPLLDSQAIPGDRLFIGPQDLSRTRYSDLHLYFLFPDLTPASYYLELNPNSANRPGTRLTNDLAHADWLLLSSEWDQSDDATSGALDGDSRPNAIVRKNFLRVADYGLWNLYHRREAPEFTSHED